MKIKRVPLLLILGFLNLWGQSWQYRIVSPLMGTLGEIAIDQERSGDRYRIEARASTRGIAAFLTGKRQEHYRSEGVKKGDTFKSLHFHIERTMKKKRQIDDYRIDPGKRKIYKQKLRWKKGHLEHNSTRPLPFYTEDDLATLYHNRVPGLLRASPGTRSKGTAAGAEKIKGTITFQRATPKQAAEERKRMHLGSEAVIVIVSSPEKILGKRNRKLFLAIDPDGVLRKARLVALPIVGEIFVERVGE